jgi:hypothetical protein
MPRLPYKLPAEGSGQAVDYYREGAAATDPARPYVIPTVDRIVSGRFSAATFRIPGTASSPINLLAMRNGGASPLVAIRAIDVEVEVNAVTAYLINSAIRLFKGTTDPTGGTAVTKTSLDSTDTASSANVELVQGASADGTASAITYALPTANPLNSESVPKVLTGVGQWLTDDLKLWEYDWPPIILRNTESILVASVGNLGTTLGLYVKILWEEFTRP